MHLDLDTNYPYLISFYHDSVWCLAVTRPGRDCLCVAPLTPQRPDQYHHRPGRVLRRPGLGAGQPPSEAINLQSTESLRPSPPSRLRGQCPGNCLSYLDFYKSANYFITWYMKPSPDVRESRMSSGGARQATYRNKIAFQWQHQHQPVEADIPPRVSQLYLSQQRLLFAQSSFCNTICVSADKMITPLPRPGRVHPCLLPPVPESHSRQSWTPD